MEPVFLDALDVAKGYVVVLVDPGF